MEQVIKTLNLAVKYNLTVMQMKVLAIVLQKEKCVVWDIMGELNISRQYANQVLLSLQIKSVIDRTTNYDGLLEYFIDKKIQEKLN